MIAAADSDEFPSLRTAGLYAAETRGNGDCLFHALSDQMYGNQSQHAELRAAVVSYMRENSEDYKPFLAAVGNDSRKPKRKNHGALQTGPTSEEINAQFERHLDNMARGGTYGDNLEIQAFANAYGYDVKIWHHNQQAWLLRANTNTHMGQALHIAYHEYEHYSSVRNLSGPQTGLPNVREEVEAPLTDVYSGPASPGSTIVLQTWKVAAVKRSLPYFASTEAVHRALRRAQGNVGDTVSHLIENEERTSVPSTPGSSSVERDPDEDEEGESASRAKRPSQPHLGVEIRGKKTHARKVQQAEKINAREPSPSSSASQASIAPTPSPDENGHVTPLEDLKPLPKPRGGAGKKGKPSASAAKAIKKREQKQAAKERKQEKAATKAIKPKPAAGIPTNSFQTLEI